MAKAKSKKPVCQARLPICSNELVARYSVNASGKEGTHFYLCGPCTVYLKRNGHEIKPAKPSTKAKAKPSRS
jgi:hypothetical protein